MFYLSYMNKDIYSFLEKFIELSMLQELLFAKNINVILSVFISMV